MLRLSLPTNTPQCCVRSQSQIGTTRRHKADGVVDYLLQLARPLAAACVPDVNWLVGYMHSVAKKLLLMMITASATRAATTVTQ